MTAIPAHFQPLAATRIEIRNAMADGRVTADEAQAILSKAMPTGKVDLFAAKEVAALYRKASVFEDTTSRELMRSTLLGHVSPRQLGISFEVDTSELRTFLFGANGFSRSRDEQLDILFPDRSPDIGGAMPSPAAGFELTPFKPDQMFKEFPEQKRLLDAAVGRLRQLGLPDEDGDLRVSVEVISKKGAIYGFAVTSFSDYPPVTSHWGRTVVFDRNMSIIGEFKA